MKLKKIMSTEQTGWNELMRCWRQRKHAAARAEAKSKTTKNIYFFISLFLFLWKGRLSDLFWFYFTFVVWNSSKTEKNSQLKSSRRNHFPNRTLLKFMSNSSLTPFFLSFSFFTHMPIIVELFLQANTRATFSLEIIDKKYRLQWCALQSNFANFWKFTTVQVFKVSKKSNHTNYAPSMKTRKKTESREPY